MTYLEAVTICVDHADILRIVIPQNRHLFDNWIIVTASHDKETQDLCKYYKINFIITDVFYDNGDVFNKAKGINEGLKKLKRTDWVLHLDADIILPANFRQICKEDQLQKDAIYGIDRVDVIGDKKIWELLSTKHSQIMKWTYLNTSIGGKFRQTFRLHNLNAGYNVIGFFQLFHSSYLKEKQELFKPAKWYPEIHQTAARTDVAFQQQWPLNKRLFYPGIIAYHLMTEDSPKSTNWEGRKSRRIGSVKGVSFIYEPEYTSDIYEFKTSTQILYEY